MLFVVRLAFGVYFSCRPYLSFYLKEFLRHIFLLSCGGFNVFYILDCQNLGFCLFKLWWSLSQTELTFATNRKPCYFTNSNKFYVNNIVLVVFSNVNSAYITLAAVCCSGILHCKKQFFEFATH